MKFTIPHGGSKEAAIAKVKQMLVEMRPQMEQHATDIKTEWDGDVLTFAFTAEGKHIEGTLTARESDFEVYAKLPLMMRMFEGTIERMIQAEVAKLKM